MKYFRAKHFDSEEKGMSLKWGGEGTAQCDVIKCESIDLDLVLESYLSGKDITGAGNISVEEDSSMFIVSMPYGYQGELNESIEFFRLESEINGSDFESVGEVSCLSREDELKKVLRAEISSDSDAKCKRKLDSFLQGKLLLRDVAVCSEGDGFAENIEGYYFIDRKLFRKTSGNGRIFLVRKKDVLVRRDKYTDELKMSHGSSSAEYNSELLGVVSGLPVSDTSCAQKVLSYEESKEVIRGLGKLLSLQVHMRLNNKSACDMDIVMTGLDTKKIRFRSSERIGIHERNKKATMYETPYSTRASGLDVGLKDKGCNPLCMLYGRIFGSISDVESEGLRTVRIKHEMRKRIEHCSYGSFQIVDAFFEDEGTLRWHNKALESKSGLTRAGKVLVKDVDILLDDLLIESEIINRDSEIEVALELVTEEQARRHIGGKENKQRIVMHGVEEYLKFKVGHRLEVYNQTVCATAYDMIPLRMEKLKMEFVRDQNTLWERIRTEGKFKAIGLTLAEYDEVRKQYSVKCDGLNIFGAEEESVGSDKSAYSDVVQELDRINRANTECIENFECFKEGLISRAVEKRRERLSDSEKDEKAYGRVLEEFSETFTSEYNCVFKDVQHGCMKIFHDNMYHGIMGIEVSNALAVKHRKSLDERIDSLAGEFTHSLEKRVQEIVGDSNGNGRAEEYRKSIHESILSRQCIGKISRVLVNKFLEILSRDLLVHDETIDAGILFSLCQSFVKKSVESLCRATQTHDIINTTDLFLTSVKKIHVFKDLLKNPFWQLRGADVLLLKNSAVSLQACTRVIHESCAKRSVLSNIKVPISNSEIDFLAYDPRCGKVLKLYKAKHHIFHHKFILAVLCILVFFMLLFMFCAFLAVLHGDFHELVRKVSSNALMVICTYSILTSAIGILCLYEVFTIRSASAVLNKTKITKLHPALLRTDNQAVESSRQTSHVGIQGSLSFKLSLGGIFTVVVMLMFLGYEVYTGIDSKFSFNSVNNIVFSGIMVLLGLVLSFMGLNRNRIGSGDNCDKVTSVVQPSGITRIAKILIVMTLGSEFLLFGCNLLRDFKVVPSLEEDVYELLIKALMVTMISSVFISSYVSYLSTCAEAKCKLQVKVNGSCTGEKTSCESHEVIYNLQKLTKLIRVATGIAITVIGTSILLYGLHVFSAIGESVVLDCSIMCAASGVVLAFVAIALKIFSKLSVSQSETPDGGTLADGLKISKSCDQVDGMDSSEQPEVTLSESHISELSTSTKVKAVDSLCS